MKDNIHDRVRKELQSCGLPWSIESGGKHLKLRVGNKLAGIISRAGDNGGDPRAVNNCISQIRRVVREIKNGNNS
jgi:hypothetical protein